MDKTRRTRKAPQNIAASRSGAIRLRELREAAGLTQARLAKLVGVTRNAVSQWEAGETTPTLRRLEKVSKILGVAVDAILVEAPEDARERVLSSAERLISNLGVRGTSAEIICAAANVERSVLDRCFGSLEQLFSEIVRRGAARKLEELRKSPPLYGSILSRLKYFLRICYVVDLENRALTSELHAYSWAWGADLERENEVQLYRLDHYIYEMLESAAGIKQIERGNFTEAAQLIMAAYVASLRKAVFESYDADQMIQIITPKLAIVLEAYGFKDVPGFSEDR